tara:strand:- start:1784 stop:2617 length:834 start_codon:yes stop_codon:yes gene_type:complete
MRKPNLFLVGAPKAGSTLLWTMLKEHKDIFFSTNPEKEINYFSYDELTHNSYYKDYKVKSEYDYLKVFKKGQLVKYLVDGSVSYFAYPSIPKKLYEFNSDAKIIVIVRDPVLRAFSHYNMDKRMGYVTEPFSEYLMNKDNKHDQYLHQYIENSLYYKHVNNYLEYFDRNQLFILQLEKINDDFDRLCEFLDIEKLKLESNNERINANKVPTNIISRTLQHNRYLATILKKIIPRKIVRSFNFLLYKKAEKVQLKESEKLLLEKYLNEDYLQFKKNIL